MKLFFFATDETATRHESYTKKKKRPIFDHRLCFSMWSRLKSYEPISLKPMDLFSSSGSKTWMRPLVLRPSPDSWRQHGWMCTFVAFLTLPLGLLKDPLSLNNPGALAAKDDFVAPLSAFAGT